ncbi:hypothetical protein GCM10009539_58620 [Cryptosporangium japonicum]
MPGRPEGAKATIDHVSRDNHMDSTAFVTASWRKSRRSATINCVEIAETPDLIGVRDSKNPEGAVLAYPVARWAAFLHGVKLGEFDRP